MSKLERFPLTDRQQLESRLDQATERERCRIEAVLLYHQGHSGPQIAARLQVSAGTVYHWLHRFQTEGITGLQDRPHPGRPRKVDAHYRQALAELVQDQPGHWTAEALRQTMAERTGVSICTGYLRQLLRQMGFAYCWAPVGRAAA
jgi:transposase